MFEALALCIASITDGDTFRLCDGEKVRLAHIDAPELHSAKCPAERRRAIAARDRLSDMLRGGNVVLVRSGRDRDRYGRLLRVVRVEGRDVGDQLVREGLARVYRGKREGWC